MYKRQSLSDENAQKLAYNTALETVTATVNSQKDVIRTAVEATVRTVSYTHLDVYKRQLRGY